jgi:hypothetical protein
MDNHHTASLQKWLPNDSPPFQLASKPLNYTNESGGTSRIRVLFLQCEEAHSIILKNLRESFRTQIPWIYINFDIYNDKKFKADEKLAVMDHHNTFHSTFWNFIVPGFKENSEDTPLQYSSTNPTVAPPIA